MPPLLRLPPEPFCDQPGAWIALVACDGDRAAFAKLFRRFAPKLKSYFLRNGFEDGEAEDLSQETLLRVWRCAGQFDPAKCEAWGWIYAIARNLRIDRHRKAVRRSSADLPPAEPPVDPEAQIVSADAARRLRGALNALPDDLIAVVRLAYYADNPHSEIARRLNLPLGTVKSRLRRAAARLRATFDE
jgi:RNA polymerase sigma-70 factor (ECF subfamily)